MPAKLTLICTIYSINERDTPNYIVRKTIGVMRREEDVNIDLKIMAFFLKNPLMPKRIPLFIFENVFLRFTGKFIFNE